MMCLTKERASTLVWDLLASAFVQLFGLQPAAALNQLGAGINTVAASLQPLSGELTKLSFNWPLKILWLMVLVSFLCPSHLVDKP